MTMEMIWYLTSAYLGFAISIFAGCHINTWRWWVIVIPVLLGFVISRNH